MYKDGTLQENVPRWRIHYEYTGRTDKIFRGAKRLEVRTNDFIKSLKFLDAEKTTVNLLDPTNKFLLEYENKRRKKTPILYNYASVEDDKSKKKGWFLVKITSFF